MDDLSEHMETLTIVDEDTAEEEIETLWQVLLADGNSKRIIVRSDFSNIDIEAEDMLRMRDGEWLNDQVINFYLGLLQQRELRKNPVNPRFHFFSTFFYNKLSSKQYNYQAVRKWTLPKKIGYNILNCEKLIVPVHQEKKKHWVMGVINIRQQRIEFYDSLSGVDKLCMRNLQSYILDEFADKGSEDLNTQAWSQEVVHNNPHQTNAIDCGVFMLSYIDCISSDAPFTFSQEDIPSIRKRFALQILKNRVD
ncbi:hypothetical protein CYMTET_27096 [Cymbomonas tetramitiformis]|uniref:Ubiquitin-like protease family profile domain-containing protein n=1 Tax=Cymbomonas tetramitiformis TaxID=36881 RepID=A0AAE0FQF9_9CHLO|nr:hypothetical protein CYMTET_27096 [Cymbomonas tetramitiformis]|eukprot:gene3552-4477_t